MAMEDNKKEEFSLIEQYIDKLYDKNSFNNPEIKYRRKKDTYTLKRKIKMKTIILSFLLGIIIFMLVVFPLYVSQYTNFIGTFFDKLIKLIGNYMLLIGGAVFIIGVISLVFRKKAKWLLIGFLLIAIGMLLTGGSFNFFGFDFTLFEQQQGYH
jgi:uncharacterized BrkB/YihY/UPF0761 family membrane protein